MNRYLSSSSLVAIFFAFASAAHAGDGPQRKPGLWESKIQTNGATLISQMCVDAATEAAMRSKTDGYMKQNCSRYEKREEGGKWITDSVCTFAGTQVTGHTVTTGDDAAVHTVGTTNADARWLGPCKPGQKPGVPMMMPGPMTN